MVMDSGLLLSAGDGPVDAQPPYVGGVLNQAGKPLDFPGWKSARPARF
jgi:hypothetical protein